MSENTETQNTATQPQAQNTPAFVETQESKQQDAEFRQAQQPQPEVKQEPAVKKTFSRANVKRSVTCPIHFPRIYPDYEPFIFEFRLKLSAEAEESRQQHLSLSAVEQTKNITNEALNEICDLMVSLPQGFDDLKDTGMGPGHSFRSYYETTTDPDAKTFLAMVIEAADSAYWNAVSAREFRS